ncbi:PadR family transcriptional regulator [Listeria newyorkensis]|uniref:PadR family transcriptional regulator n=1 Tax=Listeria newyorkensis TaxID=1497681 RepID=A0ABX4XRE3_9LIST|nr:MULTISPECIES: PadR family transcriptional regulator [Listeria]KGL39220.1 DNA-binding protein [Listeriaceae bacterium FSL A5-0209]KGL43810.1 DNA-binding protein [Listeria newyorkensis]KMT61706.1 transcriptional regulator, PadR-like family protein [Listeria newyorkensis]PNP95053.1 PadR family transcriptional regulator [Listeria newyorkensis]RQW66440.1 PadR family transcriptional regulator [Listeria sp. SHR_NRA_18]
MKISKELLKGSTTTLILSLLHSKPMYGYEIIKELERKSEGIFSLKEGTIYPLLHTLEDKGLIISYWEEGQGKRKRKYYNINEKGKEFIKEKKEEWSIFKTAVDEVLKGEKTVCD